MADEPVSALDVTVQSQILKLLLDMHEERKNTLLFVSHDLNVVRCVCHRVAVLYLGEVVESGAVEEIYHNPCHPYTRLLLASSLGENSEKEKAERNRSLVNWSLTLERTLGGRAQAVPSTPDVQSAADAAPLSRPETMSLENGHKVKCFGCQAPSAEGRQKGEAI